MPGNMTLVSTKLKMPSPRRNHIRREALFAKLDGIAGHRITIVKGTAGSGKTTLLSSYILDKAAMPFKWLTLDRDLDDSYAFWRYFTEAVTDALGEIRQDMAALFDAALNRAEIGSLLTILINQLSLAGDFAVVLDDFHTIVNAELLQSIEYFIKNSSENVHFVLSTREEPQIYVGDVAMAGGLFSIGEEELRFTDGESEAFLNDTLGLSLARETLLGMSRQAEGWVGGLQLLALASAGGNAAALGGIRALGRYAVEYLQKEILNSLPVELRQFMIKTSQLSSFDEAMCNTLLGRPDSGAVMQTLIDKNLFITDIGDDRHSFRYHNIFSEFLKLRFNALDEVERRAFHLDAARYYEQQGDHEECMRHLLKTADYESAMAMIKRESGNYRLWAFLTEIPLDILRKDRELVIQRLFYVYYNDGSDKLLSLFDAFRHESDHDEYWRILKITKAILVDLDFRIDLMSADEIDAMGLDNIAKAILCVETAAFLYMKYNLNDALAILDKAEALQSGIGNPFIGMSVLSIKSGVKEELGDLAECERLYDKIFALMREHRVMEQLSFNFHVGVTGIYLKTGRLECAEASLEAAVATAGRTDLWSDAGYLYNLMELRLLQGKAGEAYALMQKLLGMDFYQNLLYASGLIKYLAYMGRLTNELAERYIGAYRSCEPRFLRIEDKLSFARILCFLGKEDEALELADDLLEALRGQKIRVKLIEALLFKSGMLATHESMQKERLDLLREAVYYGAGNRILSPFLLEGPAIARSLLQLIDQRNRDLGSVEKLFAGELAGRFRSVRSEDLLSDRELEVLRHLATGASNREIADRLFISVSTVKTHIISIYSKLQAGNRMEAVEKGRGMGLIP